MDAETKTVIQASLSASDYTKGAEEVVSANRKISASGDQVVQTQEKTKRSLIDGGSAYARLVGQLMPAIAQQQAYERAITKVNLAVQNGRDPMNMSSTVLALLAQKYGQVGSAAADAGARMEAAATRARAAATTLLSQDTTAELDRLRSRLDPRYAASKQYEATLQDVARAQQIGLPASVAEQARARAAATLAGPGVDELHRARMELDPRYAASKQYEEQLNQIERARTMGLPDSVANEAQERANKAFSDKVDPAKAAAEAQKAAAKATADHARELEELRARYDPVFAVSKKYEAELNEINKAEKDGVLSSSVAAAARERASQALAEAGKKSKRSAAEAEEMKFATAGVTRELIVLGHELTVGNYNRIPGSLMVITERIGGLGSLFPMIGRFLISPLGMAVTATAALATGMTILGVHAENVALRMEKLQNTLRGVRDDFTQTATEANAAARHLAATTPIGASEARSVATDIESQPGFQGTQAQLEALIKTANDLAITLGTKLPDEGKRMAQAINDPAAAMQKLLDENHLKGINQALIDQAKLLEQSGRNAEAFQLYLDAVRRSVAGATQNVTPLQKAIEELDKEFTSGSQHGESFGNALGKAFDSLATHSINAVTSILRKLGEARQFLSHYLPWAKDESAGAGQPVLNNNDAVGMFQLRRDAAADVGMTPDQRADYGMNILGGLRYFHQKLDAFGNLDDATRAFNQGEAGARAGKGYGYLADVEKQDVSHLDPKVRADIETAFGTIFSDVIRAGGGSAARQRIEQIALQESGGHQYGPAAKAAAAALPPAGAASATGVVDTNRGLYDKAQKGYDQLSPLSLQVARNQAEQQLQQQAEDAARGDLRKAMAGGDSAAATQALTRLAQAHDALDKLRGAAVDLITEQEKLAKTAQDSVAPLTAEAGAMRVLAETRERFVLAAEKAGKPLDTTALAQAQAADLTRLSTQANDNIAQMQRANAARRPLVNLTEQGPLAVQLAEARSRAEEEARRTSIPGPERQRQVAALTGQATSEITTGRDIQAGGSVYQATQQTASLRLQASLISASVDQRNREIAALQERQKLGLGINDQLTAEEQKAVAAAQAVAGIQTQLSQQQAAYGEFVNTVGGAFDSIGSAISHSLFEKPHTALQSLASAAKSIFAQLLDEAIKMSIVNPLKNWMFPSQHSPTASDLIAGTNASNADAGGLGGGGRSGGGSGIGPNLGLLGSVYSKLGGVGGVVDGISNLIDGFTYDGMAAGANLAALSADAASTAASSGIEAGSSIMTDMAGSLPLMHSGGRVGIDASGYRMVPLSLLDHAPRYHSGLNSDEFAAILQRGERVLTANQNARMERMVSGMSATPASQVAQGPSVVMHVHTNDAGSFQRSASQIGSTMASALSRAKTRNG